MCRRDGITYGNLRDKLRFFPIDFYQVRSGGQCFGQWQATGIDKCQTILRLRRAHERGTSFDWNSRRKAARDHRDSLVSRKLKRACTNLLKFGPFGLSNRSSGLKDLGNFSLGVQDFQVDARRLTGGYRHRFYLQEAKSRKQLSARGAAGETNPCWSRAQAFERHGDVRGLASGVAINFCDAIDAARKKSVHYKPCVDRGIQAHAKECGCEGIRVCSWLIHLRDSFPTTAWQP